MDFKSLKVAELKEELKKRGLALSGKKAELVSRLEDYEKNHGAVENEENVEEVEDATAAAAAEEEEEEEGKQKGDAEEGKKDDVKEEQGKQGEREEATAITTAAHEDTRGVKASSRALMVSGFQRPFTLSAARAFMEQHGTVVDMWMPVIKDKAYVVYETLLQAEDAFKHVIGKTWPSNSTKTLEPVYISVYEAEGILRKGKGDMEYAIERTSEDPEDPPSLPPVEEPEEPHCSKDEEAGPPQKRIKVHDDNEEEPGDLSELFRSTQATPMIYWQTVKPFPSSIQT